MCSSEDSAVPIALSWEAVATPSDPLPQSRLYRCSFRNGTDIADPTFAKEVGVKTLLILFSLNFCYFDDFIIQLHYMCYYAENKIME